MLFYKRKNFKSFIEILYQIVYQIIFFIIILPIIFIFFLPYCRIRYHLKKRYGIKPNILWGPTTIINIYYNSRAVRLYGYKSDTLAYSDYKLTKNDFFDYNLDIFVNKIIRKLLLTDIWVFLWSLTRYDIYHFYYDRGLLNPRIFWIELPLLKLFCKRIVVCAYGGDVRTEIETRNLGKYNFYMDFTHKEILETYGSDAHIKRRVNRVIRYANASISAYDMIEYTPGSRNNIFYWAIDTDKWKPVYVTNNPKVVIVHGPNHPKYKGTRFILDVIDRLKREKYPIEFILVQGMLNDEARKIYEKADIIIDQLIGGAHGFFAIEAMALGKPVICYLKKKEYLPDWADCPIFNTNPDNLYENLTLLIKNKELRMELGKKGRVYVENVYSLEKVGGRFDKVYKEIW